MRSVHRLVPAWAACLALIPAAWATEEETASAHPLLELARERGPTSELLESPVRATGLREAEHLVEQAQPPADDACARSIGALRYAELYANLAAARSAEGDFAGAAHEYRRAHACRPRDAGILAALAGALFDARDVDAAREAADAALAIDERSVSARRLAGNIAFVEQRWPDAIAHFRYVAGSDPDRVQAGYGQLMYWLAQRRGGVAEPQFVERTAGEGWPQPLLQFMRGELLEDELVEPIRRGDDFDNTQPNTTATERLCEALFYVGEEYWARGQPDVARDYFAALVNIKVLYFLEHGLALAELSRLR